MATSLLNLGLFQTNFVILIDACRLNQSDENISLISITSFTLFLQLFNFLLNTWLYYSKPEYKYKCFSIEGLNTIAAFVSGLILICNIPISILSV